MEKVDRTKFKEVVEKRTNLYIPEVLDKSKPVVLISSQDRGSSNALFPVAESLQKKDYNVVVFASDASRDSWKSFPGKTEGDIDYFNAIKTYHPDIILTGVSQSGPGIERYFTRIGKKEGIPVLWFYESFGTASHHHLLKPHGQEINPDFILVSDSVVKKNVLEGRESMGKDQVLIAGHVISEKYKKLLINKESIRSDIRKRLGIKENEKVLLFAGQLEGTEETLSSLIDELNNLPYNIFLITRFHPRDSRRDQYNKILERYKDRVVDTSEIEQIEELLIAADVVCSMFSTVNLNAIYLKQPTIYLLHEESARKKLVKDAKTDVIPAVELGAAAQVNNREDVGVIVDRCFNDNSFKNKMSNAQNESFSYTATTESYVERIINKVDELISERQQKEKT